jgi:hypothetical protein
MQDLLLLLIFIVLLLVIFVTNFMFFRNEWVWKKRNEIILYRYDEFDDYISYQEMFKKFWIWDIEKMRKVRK